MSGEREHRIYSPSQADAFFKCAMRQRASLAAPPEPESPYAKEGTDAHEVLQAALENGVRDAKTAHLEYSTLFMYELDTVVNEFYLAIDQALDYVYGILDEFPDALLFVERFVNPPIESRPGQAGGYCDVAILIPSLRKLHVIDYKHGAGIAKDAKGNRQMLGYGAGFLYDENSPVDIQGVDIVELTIIQPRAFHVDGPERSDFKTPFELYEYLQELDERIAFCESDESTFTPDIEACRFCSARFKCAAREEAALKVANSAFSQIADVVSSKLPETNSLEFDRLGRIRHMAPLLRQWLSDCEQEAFFQAAKGHHIPGAKLVDSADRREWHGDEATIAQHLAALIGPDFDPTSLYEIKLIPLTTAEKMVVRAFQKRVSKAKARKAAEEARRAFATLTLKTTSGKLTLANMDDPRKEVKRDPFAQVGAVLPPPGNA